jgi:hypothetical protein
MYSVGVSILAVSAIFSSNDFGTVFCGVVFVIFVFHLIIYS